MIPGKCIRSASAVHSFDTESTQALESLKRHLRNSKVKTIRELSRCGLAPDVKQRCAIHIFHRNASSSLLWAIFWHISGSTGKPQSCWGSTAGVSGAGKGEKG